MSSSRDGVLAGKRDGLSTARGAGADGVTQFLSSRGFGRLVQSLAHAHEEVSLFLWAGDPKALKCAVEARVDVKLANVVGMKVEKGAPSPREGSGPAFSQLGNRPKLDEQRFDLGKVVLCGMSHMSSMTFEGSVREVG